METPGLILKSVRIKCVLFCCCCCFQGHTQHHLPVTYVDGNLWTAASWSVMLSNMESSFIPQSLFRRLREKDERKGFIVRLSVSPLRVPLPCLLSYTDGEFCLHQTHFVAWSAFVVIWNNRRAPNCISTCRWWHHKPLVLPQWLYCCSW